MAESLQLRSGYVFDLDRAVYKSNIINKLLGWMSTLGWLASVSSSVFVLTTLIEAIIDVKNADYTFTSWQFTLTMLAFLAITIIFNTSWAKILPMMETISLFLHLGGFLLTIIPLLVLCPKNSAKQVFTEVVNSAGVRQPHVSKSFLFGSLFSA